MKASLSVLRQPLLLLLLLLLLAVASRAGPVALPGQSPKPVSYDGVKVFRIQLDDSAEQAAQLRAVIDRLQLETWTHVVKPAHRVDVVVEPGQLAAFAAGTAGIPYTTMHDDLGASIRAESVPASSSSAVGTFRGAQAPDMSWFDAYHPYAQHLEWLSHLAGQFPAHSRLVTAGQSYQGRNISGIHIFGHSGGGHRPAVIMHSTVHAREWITTMVNEYIVYQLLSNYANSTKVRGFIDKYDFYIFPVVNPDGFVHSQTTARLWRKNRAPVAGNACIGTDINRNWNFAWSQTGGASTDPCAQDYKGPSAGSTPEYRAVSKFQDALAYSQGVKMYIDIHSYSQLWMTPYGYSCTAKPSNSAELVALARGAAAAIKAVYGTAFKAGPMCNTIYQVSGGSTDYSYDVTGAKYSFAIELRDTGNYGFVLPPSQIRPSGAEMWAAMLYTLANIV